MSAPLVGRALSRRFATLAALDRVDVSLPAGRLLVVVGPNGSGKTTLLRILSGVLGADSGSVELLGAPLETHTRRAVARALAVVPQELQVPFPLGVEDVEELSLTLDDGSAEGLRLVENVEITARDFLTAGSDRYDDARRSASAPIKDLSTGVTSTHWSCGDRPLVLK